MVSCQSVRQQLGGTRASLTPTMHVIDTHNATKPVAPIPMVTTADTDLMYVENEHTPVLDRPPTGVQVVPLPHVPGSSAHVSSRSKRKTMTMLRPWKGETCRVSCWTMIALR